MKILLCHHSKQRLRNRRITVKNVKTALQNITCTVPAKKKGRNKICGKINGKMLWVVYEMRKTKSHFIITAYWA